MNKFRLLSIAVFLLFASVSYSQQHPDLSGEWMLNLKKSKLEAKWTEGLEKGIVRIVHDEPDFRYWRVFIIKGKDDVLSFALPTGGQEKIEDTRDRKVTSSLSWKQDTLIYTAKTFAGKRETVNIARYYLIPDSARMVMDELFTAPKMNYHNIWVFEKK
jgi:hypothetical protein